MKGMRWGAVCLALFCALTGTVGAAGELERVMDEFREEYGLNENNFSLCYRDTVTGEEYRFNDKAFLFAASTYKLPLNLYYYEMEAEGTLSPSASVGGVPLSRAHYQSLVWSDNDVSHAMIYNLGNFRTYKEKMRKYFTMEDEEIAPSYYTGNYYCTAMMLDALKYLYERRESFPELLDYMGQAQPGEYFERYAGETEIAHKYGFYYDEEKKITSVNDTGIINAAHPFLLAVYTQNAGDGLEVVARACERLIAYNEEAARTPEVIPDAEPERESPAEPEAVPEPEPAPEPLPIPAAAHVKTEPPSETEPLPEQEPVPEEPAGGETPQEVARRNIWWMVLVAAFIFLLADLGAFFWMRNGGLKRMEEKWGDEDEDENDDGARDEKEMDEAAT